jgi:SAM-dependent methyltransferase
MSDRSPDLPLPPRELAARVYGLEYSDPDAAYLELGAQTKRQIVELLPDDWSFEGKRVLDFGSGAGRTLRHFADEAETAEFWGCDIDGPSVEWMQKSLCPPFHAWQTISVPPLALEHGSFDLVYAVSVFTHLTDNSTPWLLELHRTLKPDGLLIATFMGRWTSEWFAKEPWVEDRVGKNALYHHRDWDVLRKRDVQLDPDELDRPSGDPRELAALQHNIRQLQREVVTELESARVRHEWALADQATDYERRIRELEERIATLEGSISWRATEPLRRAAEAVRARGGGHAR